MVRSVRGWVLAVLAFVLLLFRNQIGTVRSSVFGRRQPVLLLVGRVADLWWVALVLGGVVLAYDYGFLDRMTSRTQTGRATGTAARARKPISREDIIQATNWSRVNFIVFRRSIGVSLAAAGLIGTIIALVMGRGPSLISGITFIAMIAGIWVVLTSRTRGKEISDDYTHRVSVRIPDLFEPHSFHLHLRQIAEDLGYVMADEISPGVGGVPAQFDEDVFLSEGGFIARKRPIMPPLSPFPEESLLADLVNVTSISMAAIFVSIAAIASSPSSAMLPIGLVVTVVGILGLLYSYIVRTRNWARLYCLVEGTVHTPTANLYAEGLGNSGTEKLEPTISSPESATELIVTVGVRSSPYFDDEELQADFTSFVDDIDTVAQANSSRVLETQLGVTNDDPTTGRADQ
ncbi:MAG: hypothetical protein ABEJ94_07640 [Halorientalis sp.]